MPSLSLKMVYIIVIIFLYVPNGDVRFQIIQIKHDALVVGRFRFNKTMELVSWKYWWL
jgi:hypothetical protein